MSRREATRTIGAIVATMALPFAAGAALYASGWHPTTPANHGQLVEPRSLPQTAPIAPGGEPLPPERLRGRWWLVLARNGSCDAACRTRLDEMRRIHVALNREMPRLGRLLLTTETDDASLAALQSAQPDLLVARPDAAWRAAFLGTRGIELHVVDPQLRLVLRYPRDATAAAIHADLRRLLR